MTSAPELARLSLNLAMTHTDATAGRARPPPRLRRPRHRHRRRARDPRAARPRDDPGLALLRPPRADVRRRPACTRPSTISELEPLDDGGLVHFRAQTQRAGRRDGAPRDVLDWRARGADAMTGHPRRPAGDRGLGVRRRAARRDDAGAARRRRDPLRRHRRRPRLPALAAGAGRREPVLGRPEQGQALDLASTCAPTRGASSSPPWSRRPATSSRTSRRAAGSPTTRMRARREDLVMVGADRQPRRHERGRLHGQPGDRLPAGDRAAQPRRAGELRAAGVGRGDGRPRRDRPAGRRSPPHAHRRGPARRPRALRRRLRDGRPPRPRRRGRSSAGATSPRTATTSTAPSATTSPPRDDRRVMVVALTGRQWTALLEVTGLQRRDRARSPTRPGLDLDRRVGPLRGPRPDRRGPAAVVRRPRPRRDPRGVRPAPASPGGPTRRSASSSHDDPRCSTENPMWEVAEHPGVGRYLMPGTPLDFSGDRARAGAPRAAARRAHRRRPARAARASPTPRSAASCEQGPWR